MNELQNPDVREKAIVTRKENMGQFFELNKLTKKKRSLESRINVLVTEKRSVEEQINTILKNVGISTGEIQTKIPMIKMKRVQQIAELLSQKGPMSAVELGTSLQTNSQNIYQVLYRDKDKLFKVDTNKKWALIKPEEQNIS